MKAKFAASFVEDQVLVVDVPRPGSKLDESVSQSGSEEPMQLIDG